MAGAATSLEGLRPFRPSVAFRDGKLYRFNRSGVLVIRPWPDPRAWQKTLRLPHWIGRRPSIDLGLWSRYARERPVRRELSEQLLLPGTEPRRRRTRGEVYRLALDAIPQETRELIRPFPDSHWELLNLLARCPGPGEDLMRLNPMLAVRLVFAARLFGDSAWRIVRRFLRLRQRDIARHLDLPGTESTVRILKKLPPRWAAIREIFRLDDALRDARARKLLAHVPRINAAVASWVSKEDLWDRVSPNLLAELAALNGRETVREAEALASRILELGTLARPDRPLPAFRSLEGVRALRDELEEGLNRSALAFPPPPLPGTGAIADRCPERLADPRLFGVEIVPITDSLGLVCEGRQQRNCVSDYVDSVAKGVNYVYRMLAPVRATLALCRDGCRWGLMDVRLSCNREPDEAVREVVRLWIWAAMAAHASE